ncbi:glycosyltransferase family 2 protein [Methylobacterium mesophilicum]
MQISCIVTLHSEGYLAHRTIKSIMAAVKYAKEFADIDSEIIIVADNPSNTTELYINQELLEIARVFYVKKKDPGLSRNHGIEQARGDYIAILDGDDLISKNWLAEAYALASRSDNYVVHPEYNIFFGAERRFLRHIDQESIAFDPSRLLLENFWSALSFSKRETYESVKYEHAHLDDGLGYEDWHWNCEVIALGFIHKVAVNTKHFIRLKKVGSRNDAALSREVLLRHSRLFDDGNFFFRDLEKTSDAD